MTIPTIIQQLKTGNRIEYKEAQKELEKLWHGRPRDRKMLLPFLGAMEEFDSITNVDNQVAFVSALKLPFLSFGEDHFQQCKDFVLRILQHPSGKVRQAMIHTADYLEMCLHIYPFAQGELPEKEAERMERNKRLFGELVEDIEKLLQKYHEPRFKRYKYVESLPVGIYKSLQAMHAHLLRSEIMEEAYDEYVYEKNKEEYEKRLREMGDPFIEPKGMEQKQRRKWDYYYDAMEYLAAGDARMSRLLLQKALRIDEDFVAAYVGLTATARVEGNEEEVKRYIELAYEKTVNVFPQWPEQMRWAILENRQYLRAICDKAILHHEKGEFRKAEQLYRLLLKLNPGDNQGVRYICAALYAKLHPAVVDELTDEGNRLQNWSKLENLLREQNATHTFWKSPVEEDDY